MHAGIVLDTDIQEADCCYIWFTGYGLLPKYVEHCTLNGYGPDVLLMTAFLFFHLVLVSI